MKEINPIIKGLKGRVVISCQALKHEIMYGSQYMQKFAESADKGGACGIRANSVVDIKAIKEVTDLPILGIIKKDYENSECYITPSMAEVDALYNEAKPEIIAVDATDRIHPDGKNGAGFIKDIKAKYPDVLIMADVSTYEEGIEAEKAGADIVSTTLAGYTSYTTKTEGPDYELMRKLASALEVPVIGEGRIWTREEAVEAFKTGIYSLVVGTAITRPYDIAKRFCDYVAENVK